MVGRDLGYGATPKGYCSIKTSRSRRDEVSRGFNETLLLCDVMYAEREGLISNLVDDMLAEDEYMRR